MKALVICGAAWMEMLVRCWQAEKGSQTYVLRVPSRVDDPARLGLAIKEVAAKVRPDFILDANCFGIQPLKGTDLWTPEALNIPWAEWWFDDPANCAGKHVAAGSLPGFIRALENPCVKHFIWDSTLASEYSKWTSWRWVHLPAATNPEVFKPKEDAFRQKDPKSPCELFFVGTSYEPPRVLEDGSEREGVEYAAARRLNSAFDDYFAIASSEGAPTFLKDLFKGKEGSGLAAAFEPQLREFRLMANAAVGNERLNKPLAALASAFKQGSSSVGKLEAVNASIQRNYHPTEFSQLAANADAALDLGNGQSFTGTNMRIYDMMSCGAVLAFRCAPEFDPKGELENRIYLRFNSPDELAIKLGRLRSSPEAERTLRNEARAFVAGRHNWLQRLGVIMEWL